MARGKIKTLMKDRGFGFIQVDGATEEVFFHTSALGEGVYDGLAVGQELEFDVEPDPRNPRRTRAANIKVAS